jgi:hypothetical protein
MPVLECSCGMVMSTTARDSRERCMRCGSVTLSELDGGIQLLPSLRQFVSWPARNRILQIVANNHTTWTGELTEEGSHI